MALLVEDSARGQQAVEARRLDAEIRVGGRHAVKDLLFLDTRSVLVWARDMLVILNPVRHNDSSVFGEREKGVCEEGREGVRVVRIMVHTLT